MKLPRRYTSQPQLNRPLAKSTEPNMIAATCRLRKHADYQRVYQASRKQFGKQMAYFFILRQPLAPMAPPARTLDDASLANVSAANAPRIGLTVPKAIGKAVDRNRIKRRMREAVRSQLPLLHAPVDIVLHPRRSVIDLDFAALKLEVAQVFRAIQRAAAKASAQPTAPPPAAAGVRPS
jgi:ribonuclease P protein component